MSHDISAVMKRLASEGRRIDVKHPGRKANILVRILRSLLWPVMRSYHHVQLEMMINLLNNPTPGNQGFNNFDQFQDRLRANRAEILALSRQNAELLSASTAGKSIAE